MTDFDGLSTPFPKSMIRQIQKGGANLSYIPVSEVIARLNAVLGVDGWSYEVKDRWTTGEHPDGTPKWCMVHVRLDVAFARRDAIGGQPVKMLRSGEGPVDMGDEWKGAVSDALKKAAQAFGVGLDLARTEEAKAEETASRAFSDAGWIDETQYQETWAAIRAESVAVANHDEESKRLLSAWWNERQPSAPYSKALLEEYMEIVRTVAASAPVDAGVLVEEAGEGSERAAAKDASSSRQKRPLQGVQTSEPEPESFNSPGSKGPT